MYEGLLNQSINLTKFFSAFILLTLIMPSIVLGRLDEDKINNFMALYMRAVIYIIITGYLLVLFKIYEVIPMIVLTLSLLVMRIRHEMMLQGKQAEEDTGVFILKYLDKQIDTKMLFSERLHWIVARRKQYFSKYTFVDYFYLTLVLVVLGGAAYIRFHDAMAHAAFPLSDSYITLDWLKGVERRQLFYEPGGGVYPRGLSIFMATLHKFSFTDALYALKYTGPLNGLLIVTSIILVVFQFTKNKYAALTGAIVYALGAYLLGSDMDRQAATNSQEFALVFLLPTLWFASKYLKDFRKRDLHSTIIGLTLMGLIHTFVYAFGVIVVSVHIFILFVQQPVKHFKRYLPLILGGILSAIISIIPFAAGLIEGFHLHGSSVEFLIGRTDISLRSLQIVDLLEIAILIIWSICLFVFLKRGDKKAKVLLPTLTTTFIIFAMYEWGGYITQSILLDARTKEIWSLFSAMMLGVFLGCLFDFIKNTKIRKRLSAFIALIIMFSTIQQVGLKPLVPYKMEWDEGVEQYLRITKEFRPKTWTMVAEQRQYAMVTGTGFLVTTNEFVDMFPSAEPYSEDWLKLGRHIFIYQQKNIFKVKETNVIYDVEAPKYQLMAENKIKMDEWLSTFRKNGGEYTTYYVDDNIIILQIDNKAYDLHKSDNPWEEN